MEVFTLNKNMSVICVPASSFPGGIAEGFDKLMRKVPGAVDRGFFGISHGARGGEITFKAAIPVTGKNEARRLGFEEFVIKRGTYLSESIIGWRKQKAGIMGETFRVLLANERLDTSFPCVEWYSGEDVMCMVRIIQ